MRLNYKGPFLKVTGQMFVLTCEVSWHGTGQSSHFDLVLVLQSDCVFRLEVAI